MGHGDKWEEVVLLDPALSRKFYLQRLLMEFKLPVFSWGRGFVAFDCILYVCNLGTIKYIKP